MISIHAHIEKAHYRTSIAATLNTLVADEPKEHGGEELGFSPSQLLASSLGACTCITLRMYADRKQWPLEGVEAEVTYTFDRSTNSSQMTRSIKLLGTLDNEQRERLLQIANQCPIHKTLTSPIHIQTTLA